MTLYNLQSKALGTGGRLRRLEEKMELLWNAVVGLEPEDHIRIRETAEGGIAIGGGGSPAEGALENSAFIAEARTAGSASGGDFLLEVRMLGGTVQGIFGRINVIPTTYWSTDSDGIELFPEVEDGEDSDSDSDSGAETDVILGEDIEDGEIFWLEYDPNEEDESYSGSDSEAGMGRWSVKHGQELPESSTTEDVERALYFTIIPLFRVSLGGATAANTIQYHFGSVYVPTVSNVVARQVLPDDGDDSGA